MPTVPGNQSNVVQMRPQQINPTFLMMAAAEYHEAGRLFEAEAQLPSEPLPPEPKDPA